MATDREVKKLENRLAISFAVAVRPTPHCFGSKNKQKALVCLKTEALEALDCLGVEALGA